MLQPGKGIETAVKIINMAMGYAKVQYWLCFGGLWGLIMNKGVIPDGDLDICVLYGEDYKRIQKSFSSCPGGYTMAHAMLDDTDRSKALHCSFNSSQGFPHICLSFWYLHKGIRYYCHDQNFEVHGEGVPPSGYWFKGVPESAIGETRLVEWPGINQMAKISVPRLPGAILDHLYPDWAYRKQRYEVKRNQVQEDKMVSYHKGGAVSPYRVHVQSMAQFRDEKYIGKELGNSRREYEALLKTRV